MGTETNSGALRAALTYVQRGWCVLAIWWIVNGRCACPNGANCTSPGKHPLTTHGVNDATNAESRVRAWWEQWPSASVAIATGPASHLLVIDIDPRHGGDVTLEQLEVELGTLPDTLTALTQAKGRHLVFLYPDGATIASKAGQLGAGIDVRATSGYIVAAPSMGVQGEYSWDTPSGEPDAELAELPEAWLARLTPQPKAPASPVENDIPEGSRNATLTSLAGTMRRRGMEQDAVVAALLVTNESRCRPPLPESEVQRIAKSVSRYSPSVEPTNTPQLDPSPASSTTNRADWPEPLDEYARSGLVGEFLDLIESNSEADPAAMLVQFLAYFGNALGRNPYFQIEADKHYTNLFAVLAGRTSKGRKGVSHGHVRAALRGVDPTWIDNRVMSGSSSGEGVIWQVRDPISKFKRVRKKGQPDRYEDVVIDPGVDDKRLIVVESEFATVLRVLQREGSTLSPVLRNAWDCQRVLQSMTKNSPAKATDSLITFIGHITNDEMLRYLDRTEMANGFMNRFLVVCVQRSKFLPLGGDVDREALAKLSERVKGQVDAARTVRRVEFDPAARALWCDAYPVLSGERPGIFGSITGRAEAQCLRLALVYALLDGSRVIRLEHLRAAFGLWSYCEDSARHVFGDALGYPMADQILRALRGCSDGLTKTAIRDTFSRNKHSAEIDKALAFLAEKGLAFPETVSTGGRPAQLWRATTETTNTTKGGAGRRELPSFRSYMSSLDLSKYSSLPSPGAQDGSANAPSPTDSAGVPEAAVTSPEPATPSEQGNLLADVQRRFRGALPSD